MYYKIVRCISTLNKTQEKNKLFSYTGKYHPGNIEYLVGIFVFREKNCGPLTIFNTFKNAVAFITEDLKRRTLGLDYKIFSCEIIKSKERCLYTIMEGKHSFVPKGTCFADSVKLIKERKIKGELKWLREIV